MPVEKSAGAVVFTRHHFAEKPSGQKQPTKNGAGLRKENDTIYYLLLHYPSSAKASKDYWDLPKGHVEKGEKEIDAARREVEEETGLTDIEFVEGFKEWIKYFFRFEGKNILKFVTFYLAETQTKEVRVSEEHLGYTWLPYQNALVKLKFKNAKEILKKANNFLSIS